MDIAGFRALYEEKKGCPLNEDDDRFLANLSMKEMIQIWDMIKEEKDWEAEVVALQQQQTVHSATSSEEAEGTTCWLETDQACGAPVEAPQLEPNESAESEACQADVDNASFRTFYESKMDIHLNKDDETLLANVSVAEMTSIPIAVEEGQDAAALQRHGVPSAASDEPADPAPGLPHTEQATVPCALEANEGPLPVTCDAAACESPEVPAADVAPPQGESLAPAPLQAADAASSPSKAATEELNDRAVEEEVERRVQAQLQRRVEEEVTRRLQAAQAASASATTPEEDEEVKADVARCLHAELEDRAAAVTQCLTEARVEAEAEAARPGETPGAKKRRLPLHETPSCKRRKASPTTAEIVLRYQKKTPPRFRSVSKAPVVGPQRSFSVTRSSLAATPAPTGLPKCPSAAISTPRPRTQPKPFQLNTDRRASQRLSVMGPPPPVPASQVRRATRPLSGASSHLPNPPAKKTVPQPFRLSVSNVVTRSASAATVPPPPAPFRATPLNRRMFDCVGELGVPRVEKRVTTVPKAFNFVKREMEKQKAKLTADRPDKENAAAAAADPPQRPGKRPSVAPAPPAKRPCTRGAAAQAASTQAEPASATDV